MTTFLENFNLGQRVKKIYTSKLYWIIFLPISLKLEIIESGTSEKSAVFVICES